MHPKKIKAVITIRESFRPLGILSKFCGLFPCYDLSFALNYSSSRLKLIHVLDWMYSGLIFSLMTGGAVLCYIKQPIALDSLNHGNEIIDYWVILGIFYMTLLMGVISLFIFPKKFSLLLSYIEHFSKVDVELGFNDESSLGFSQLSVGILLINVVINLALYTFMFVLESPNQIKPWTDYLMIPLQAFAGISRLIPTALLIFFLNGIKKRLNNFNQRVQELIDAQLQSNTSTSTDLTISIKLNQLRSIYIEILDLIDQTNEIFGSHLFRDYLYSLIGIILYVYFILFLREDNLIFWFIYPVMVGLIIGKILILSTCVHFINQEEKVLMKILRKGSSSMYMVQNSCAQINQFLFLLEKPITITASGYFNINRNLVTSICGAIMTYLIILVQFKLSERGIPTQAPDY